VALKAAGFDDIVGVDLSPKLIELAQARGCYRETQVRRRQCINGRGGRGGRSVFCFV
jgi:hypothetical protein